MSMAAKSSNLAEKTSGSNLQTDGQAEVPTQGVKDLQEPEEDSSPSCSLSWSPVQGPLSSHPNVRYCLEICVTLTEELGPYPHPLIPGWPHWWKTCCKKQELDLPKQW